VDAVLRATGGVGVDVVFVAAAAPGVLDQAVNLCRRMGRLVLIASFFTGGGVEARVIQAREQVVLGTSMYTAVDYRLAIRLWEQGRLGQFPSLISERIRLTQAPEMVAAMTGSGDPGERPRLRPLAHRSDAFVTHLALALRDLARDGHPGGTIYGEALGAVLAEHVVRSYSALVPRPHQLRGGLPALVLRRIAEYIDANLQRDITLHELARQAQMSVYHFARAFKHRTGLPPHQYVLRRRIERARSLLSDPVLSVGDVAVRCGFAHHSHFSDTFHRVMGVTPTAYRRAM